MKFKLKKYVVLLLGLGILLGMPAVFHYTNSDNSKYNYSPSLPDTSAWGTDEVQVTYNRPLITYDDMAMCSDGAGGVIISWCDSNYVYPHVYAQRIDSNGNTRWGFNGIEMWDPWEEQTGVQMCSDGAGGAIIVWEDNRNHFYYDDIFAQRVDANGNLLWYIRGVEVSVENYYQFEPQVCSDGAGGAFIAWTDIRGADEDIYVQRINSAGNAVWTANGISICSASGAQRLPQLCSDGAGGAIVAWTDNRPGSSGYDVYVQRINSAGAAQWTANGVNIYWGAGVGLRVDIQSDGSGGAIIAWGGDNIYAQRVNSNGNPVWTMGGVAICTAGGDQWDPKITMSGSGGAIFAWEDHRVGSYDIYAQKINPTGTVQWTTNGVPLCSALGTQDDPRICSDGANGAIVTWEDKRNGNSDVYAQRIASDGTQLWTANGSSICVRDGFQGEPVIVSDGVGHAIIAWQDTRTYSGRDIYAKYIINSIPSSNHPDDIITAFERSSNIEWVLTDDTGGGQYRVLANDTNGDNYEVQGWTSWTIDSVINISVNTTMIGYFNYTLQFNDTDGQYGAFDTVLVKILDNYAPTSNHPDDIITIKYRTETVDWVLDDEWDGGNYTIMANDTNGDFYVYKNWTSWLPTDPLNIPINTSTQGKFNYTIIFYDNQNKYGVQDTVNITILNDLIPTCDHPTDISTVLGDFQYIRWTLSDDYGGGSYRVIANNSIGNFYTWRSWDSWVIGERVSIPINRTVLGIFNYTIEFYDNYGQYGMSDTVLVTVNQNNPPTCDHPSDISTTTDGTESIQWILNDDYGGGSYRVIITTSGGTSSTWIDWTSWDVLIPIQVQIDRSRTGVFNYTIEYRDIYGLYGMVDTVKVTIPSEGEFPLVLIFALIGGIGVAAVIIPIVYLKKRKH